MTWAWGSFWCGGSSFGAVPLEPAFSTALVCHQLTSEPVWSATPDRVTSPHAQVRDASTLSSGGHWMPRGRPSAAM
jgi:hypothetical protein